MELSDSSIKHTEGGRIPDTSRVAQLSSRLKAASPVLTGRAGGASILFPLVFAGALAGSIYLLWNQYFREEEETGEPSI